MTLEESAAPARSAPRDGSAASSTSSAPSDDDPPAPAPTGALAWVDPRAVTASTGAVSADAAAGPYIRVEPDLLARRPRRSPWRPGVLTPLLVVVLLALAYAATTLLWPLHAVAPTVTAVPVSSVPAPATVMPWPVEGTAAVSVAGFAGVAASDPTPQEIASITKVVTALVVLEERPLAADEQGPEYRFTSADQSLYWSYLGADESALDVPVGGVLTERQLLEGMLIGSANNYADRLAGSIWPNDEVFAAAAQSWLDSHAVPGIQIVEPTGIDRRNSAGADSLIRLAEVAMENPVVAQIVGTGAVTLPGADLVENTNGLLADPGVRGIKTGSLDRYMLLSAKDVTVGDTTVRLYASVLGQPDDETRLAVSRALYAQLELELQPTTTVAAGTLAGFVETRWGERVDVLTAADAPVILWNGASATVDTAFDLGDARTADDVVGALTATGALDTETVDLRLAADIEPPSAWWRLTHPLDLFGLND